MSAPRRDGRPPRSVVSIWPPVVLAAVAGGMALWSLGLGETARQMPLGVALVVLILCVFDLLTRLDAPLSGPLRAFWGADFANREMKHAPAPREELRQIGAVTACVAGMLLIGILPAVPLFVFGYMILFGRRPLVESAAVALGLFGFVYGVFEIALDFTLYRGAFFDSRGFAGW